MSNEEMMNCWACNELIPKSSEVCPKCDMPITDSSEEVEDIDSLLEGLESIEPSTEKIDDALPAIPSFGETEDEDLPAIPSFGEESDTSPDEAMPDIPSFGEETTESQETSMPDIPSFDDGDISGTETEMPDIPEFSSEPSADNQEQEISISENVSIPAEPTVSEEPEIPDFEEDEFPAIPSFDDEDYTAAKDIDEDEPVLVGEIVDLSQLTTNQKIRIFLPQLLYWSLVFVIISFAGVKVDNSNFTLDSLDSDYYSINAELFLFGWIAFLPMGWFYRYRLNQYNVKDSLLYGLFYLILQFIFLSVVSLILFLLVNPDAELASLSDTDTSVTTIMTTYVYFSWLGFIITGLTLGFLLFFVGYRFYFNQIYKSTPISEISN